MECKRVILGSNPGLQTIKPIPDMCRRDKTIGMNQMGIISIFKDRRPTAQAWIDEVLPTLVLSPSADKIRKTFWEMPPNGWMEFDMARKTLSYCSLEKI